MLLFKEHNLNASKSVTFQIFNNAFIIALQGTVKATVVYGFFPTDSWIFDEIEYSGIKAEITKSSNGNTVIKTNKDLFQVYLYLNPLNVASNRLTKFFRNHAHRIAAKATRYILPEQEDITATAKKLIHPK